MIAINFEEPFELHLVNHHTNINLFAEYISLIGEEVLACGLWRWISSLGCREGRVEEDEESTGLRRRDMETTTEEDKEGESE